MSKKIFELVVCSKLHVEIRYRASVCPVCELRDLVEDGMHKIIDLEEEIGELEEELKKERGE